MPTYSPGKKIYEPAVGPVTIFDKSALQALSMDEAVWLEVDFLTNVTPLFYVETLADLEKATAEGRTPEEVVGSLAAKTPSDAYPNIHHRTLISAELQGQEIEMSGRIMVAEGEYRRAPNGSLGMHIDEFPEATMLLRWKTGEFDQMEREVAKAWRADLAAHEPERMIAIARNILPAGTRISDLETLKGRIDTFCESDEREVVALALDVLEVPEASQYTVLKRWETAQRPPLSAFAPYTTHVFKVDLLYYLAIDRGFISGERASNKADMAYLYYLPFTMVFVSGDRLHQRTAPLFLRPEQSYVQANEFKAGLREIDQYYDQLPDEIKQLGVLQFAGWPPSTLENIVTRLWDKHMRPDWRDIAAVRESERGKGRGEADDRKTLADMRTRVDSAEPVTEAEAPLSGDEADYVIIRRQVPVQKGKWRMVSWEVEEAEGDD
jgi:hypothetical protein